MTEKYDVIIIGAGPSGLGCAGLLAKMGIKTLVIDKNRRYGGLLHRIQKNGFTYDFGTMAGLPVNDGRWEALFKSLDILDRFDVVHHGMELVYRDPKTKLWRHWAAETDIDIMDPTPRFDWLGLSEQERADAIEPLTEIWELCQDPDKLAALEGIPAYDFVEGTKLPPAFKSLFYMFCNGALIQSKELVDISELLPMWLSLAEGIQYPKGGFGRLPEIVAERCLELGVNIMMKTRVEKINIENDRVTGVTINGGGRFEAPIVVSSAGIYGTVLRLAGVEHFEKSYVNYVKDLIPSMSFTRCNYILSEPVMKQSYYQIHSDKSWWDVPRYNAAREGIVDKDVTISIVVNSNYDPGMAPPGKQLVQVGSNANADPEDPYTQIIYDRVDDLVAEIYPEIIPYIESKEAYIGPKEIALCSRGSDLPGQGGEICGLGQVVGQVGSQKPNPQTPVPGLFLVGVDAGGGAYMCSEQAVDSSLKVAPKVAQYLYKRQTAYWRK